MSGIGSPRFATVLTHRRPAETAPALRQLLELARDAGVTLRFDRDETGLERVPRERVEALLRRSQDAHRSPW